MELGNKHKWSTVTTVGFALFAMFFGAGNLILPPFIGLEVGNEWLWALLGFFITAIIAPFLGVLMVAKAGTNFTFRQSHSPRTHQMAYAVCDIVYRSADCHSAYGLHYF